MRACAGVGLVRDQKMLAHQRECVREYRFSCPFSSSPSASAATFAFFFWLPLRSFQTQAADQEAEPPRDREQLFMERRALAGAEAMAQEQRRKTRRLEEVVLPEGVFGRLSLDFKAPPRASRCDAGGTFIYS